MNDYLSLNVMWLRLFAVDLYLFISDCLVILTLMTRLKSPLSLQLWLRWPFSFQTSLSIGSSTLRSGIKKTIPQISSTTARKSLGLSQESSETGSRSLAFFSTRIFWDLSTTGALKRGWWLRCRSWPQIFNSRFLHQENLTLNKDVIDKLTLRTALVNLSDERDKLLNLVPL